jgi:hypothetical protein
MGWYAARAHSSAELKGAASTETVGAALLAFTEMVAGQVKSPEHFPEAWGPVKKGRKANDPKYAAWHYKPGYQIVMAWDDLGRHGQSLSQRIVRAVEKGFLDADFKFPPIRAGLR